MGNLVAMASDFGASPDRFGARFLVSWNDGERDRYEARYLMLDSQSDAVVFNQPLDETPDCELLSVTVKQSAAIFREADTYFGEGCSAPEKGHARVFSEIITLYPDVPEQTVQPEDYEPQSRILPWFSSPSFSPDGKYIVAVLAAEGVQDPATAGLVQFDLTDGKVYSLGIQGGAPAWRPALSAEAETQAAPPGPKVTRYTLDSSIGTEITDLLVTSAGSVWIAARRTGAAQLLPDGTWQLYTSADGLSSDNVTAVAEASDGAIWFGTLFGGASRLDPDGSWSIVGEAEGLTNRLISALASAPDDSLWFGYSGALARRLPDGTLETFPFDPSEGSVSAIEPEQDGSILVLMSESGLKRLRQDGTWESIPTSAKAYLVYAGLSGSIWAAFAPGDPLVGRLDPDGTWTYYDSSDGLSHHPTTIIETQDGSLWFGSERVLQRRMPDGTWAYYLDDFGERSHRMRYLTTAPDGSLWLHEEGYGITHVEP
jgi:hypothetical protein